MPALKILLSFLVGLTIAGCTLPQQPSVRPVGPAAAPNAPFTLGIDVLASNGYDLLRGKRVGLICNQTSMTGNGTLTRVALRRAGVNLVALYAPEHG
ncbi:DUF1343 domain-containing protein [Verrucomicrobium spinosum]|nr:DUF1343 domain-containing protein [Verrucomicrobium spinosum]